MKLGHPHRCHTFTTALTLRSSQHSARTNPIVHSPSIGDRSVSKPISKPHLVAGDYPSTKCVGAHEGERICCHFRFLVVTVVT